MELLIWAFLPEERAVHASTRVRTRARPSTRFIRLHCTLHGTRSGRMSLKKCVFGCEGKITLFSFPKEPTVTWTVDIVCFSGAAMEFLKCFVDERCIGPIRHWICTSFNTERWSGPSYKRSRSWFRTADGKWNGIKCLCFVGDRASARHSLAPPTRHASRSSAFFGENRKSVFFFYKYDKTKDFLEIWRM